MAEFKRQYYGFQDTILVGVYLPDGSTEGEFRFEFGGLGPSLNAFDDSWKALLLFQDLLEKMAELNSTNPSKEQFIEVLESLRIQKKS